MGRAGWEHRRRSALAAPLFWTPDGAGGWTRRRFGIEEPCPPTSPCSTSISMRRRRYARWAGGRLPTEFEWEKAAAGAPRQLAHRSWPWGEQPPGPAAWPTSVAARLRPAPAGAYPTGASAYGVEQLIGDVWEWTSSPLRPWPGFTPMIYANYSAPFFGPDYRVLRGGSWATGPAAVRTSFRNWDFPIRRQIFSGSAARLGRLMCRHVGVARRAPHAELAHYRARARPAAPVVRAAPAEHGLMNADGWGVGWWTPKPPSPARWRAARPLWGDPSFASVAPHVRATAIVAAVRSATTGMPLDETAAAPFTSGRWLLSHNGRLDRSLLPDAAWRSAESVCDSAVLASWLLEAPDELGARICEVGARDPDARLNVLASDGRPPARDGLGRHPFRPRQPRRRRGGQRTL